MITPEEVYEALQTVKFDDLNKTRKHQVKYYERLKSKSKLTHRPLRMLRDNVSKPVGTRFSGVFGKQ